jgi:hypothetical protein
MSPGSNRHRHASTSAHAIRIPLPANRVTIPALPRRVIRLSCAKLHQSATNNCFDMFGRSELLCSGSSAFETETLEFRRIGPNILALKPGIVPIFSQDGAGPKGPYSWTDSMVTWHPGSQSVRPSSLPPRAWCTAH